MANPERGGEGVEKFMKANSVFFVRRFLFWSKFDSTLSRSKGLVYFYPTFGI